jgi:hypothetical protein
VTDTVWKFTLPDPTNKVAMPAGAEVLHVAEQDGRIALWARVDPGMFDRVTRTFHVVGTGTPIPKGPSGFRGTAVAAGGSLVFHVFEEA